jgi:hypothetical protein
VARSVQETEPSAPVRTNPASDGSNRRLPDKYQPYIEAVERSIGAGDACAERIAAIYAQAWNDGLCVARLQRILTKRRMPRLILNRKDPGI